MPVDDDTKEQLTAEVAAGAVTDKGAPKPEDIKPDTQPDDAGSVTGDTPADPPADPPADDKDTETLDTEKWGTTGDETGDSVLLLLQNSGVDPETAKALLYDAVKEGDPTKIDRDALVEKFGKANANLILAGIENFVTKQNDRVAGITGVVHEAAGGKANWEKVATWARTNVSAEQRTELAAMIDAGGKQAKFAAQEYVNLYNADTKNTTINSTARVEGDAKAPDSGRAIGRREYADELARAHRAGAKPAVIKEIQAARERGRKRGL